MLNPDNVASQTLAAHQLSTTTQAFPLGLLIPPTHSCTCGWHGGDVTEAQLHLVSAGVEAGVSTVMELNDTPRELTRTELAARDLAGWLAGLIGTQRDLDESWRDDLAILVDTASGQQSFTTDVALEHGARLWVELEDWETHQVSVVHPHAEDPTPGLAWSREDGSGTVTLNNAPPTQPCYRAAVHGPHRWGMATGELGAEGHDAWCPGLVQHGGEPGPDQSHTLPHLNCDRGTLHFGHAWEPVTSGAPREAWCRGD